jgi:integrase
MPFKAKKTDYWQYDIVVGGHRFRGSTGTKDFEEAKDIEAKIRSDAKAKKSKGTDFTLTEALGTYFRDVSQHQPSHYTTASQSRSLLSIIGKKKMVTDLTDADILRFVAKKRATVSNATVNRQVQLLGRALRHMERLYKARIPALNLKAAETKEPKERIRELSFDEQARLFEHLPDDLRHPVKFALMTGARISTIVGLKWSDINETDREIIFRLKNDDQMTFPMTREMQAFLSTVPRSNIMGYRNQVFTRLDKQTKQRIRIVPRGGVFNTEFRKAVRDAEIENFRFHDLRHTFATRMLRQTKNIKLVSKLLGHKSIETTDRYAHVLVDDMRSALNEFSAISGNVPQNIPQNKILTS